MFDFRSDSLPPLRGSVNPGSEDKACIMMFNLGGASQPDLWDMKPDAPARSAQFLISS